MAKLRRQISLARLGAAIVAEAVVFALPLPWQAAWPLAIGVLIPVLIEGLSHVELCVLAAEFLVLTGLLVPAFQGSRGRNRGAGAILPAPAPVSRPAQLPPS